VSCRTGPLRVGRSLRDLQLASPWASRWSAWSFGCDHREHHATPKTRHEVTAARAGRLWLAGELRGLDAGWAAVRCLGGLVVDVSLLLRLADVAVVVSIVLLLGDG
jgi:hypothetical protein